MSEYGIREIRAASASGAAAAIAPALDRRRELSPAAMLAAAQTIVPAFSPIVLAGFVRMIELALMAAIGIAIYFAYVFPVYGFSWYYPLTAIGIAVLIVLALQTADIYQVQAFRTPYSECIRLVVALSLLFLLVAAIMFFAKLGVYYSRVWLAGFYGVGLVALVGSRLCLYGLVRPCTAEGRLDRRAGGVGGGGPGEVLVGALKHQGDSDVKGVGRFDHPGGGPPPPRGA